MRKAWYAQELYERKMLGIINLDKEQIKMLQGDCSGFALKRKAKFGHYEQI